MVVLIVSCTTGKPPWDYERDMFGNEYPANCRQDLSLLPEVQKVLVIYNQPKDSMNALYKLYGGHLRIGAQVLGLTIHYTNLTPTIFITEGLSGWKLEEVLHHERCHIIAGAWHK